MRPTCVCVCLFFYAKLRVVLGYECGSSSFPNKGETRTIYHSFLRRTPFTTASITQWVHIMSSQFSHRCILLCGKWIEGWQATLICAYNWWHHPAIKHLGADDKRVIVANCSSGVVCRRGVGWRSCSTTENSFVGARANRKMVTMMMDADGFNGVGLLVRN